MISAAALLCHAPIALPQVAGSRGDACADTTKAMREAAQAVVAADPGAVVVVSPHTPRLRRGFGLVAAPRVHGDFARFGAPEVAFDLDVDRALVAALADAAAARGVATAEVVLEDELDHGAAVPLAFLVEAGLRCPVVVVALPWEAAWDELVAFGRALADAAASRDGGVALVASGDCSHRLIPGAPAGFDPRAKSFDETLVEKVAAADWDGLFAVDEDLRDVAAEDVVDTLTIAAAATGFPTRDVRVLSYEGPFGVGYLVATLPTPRPDGAAAAASDGDRAAAAGDVVAVAKGALRAWAEGRAAAPLPCDVPGPVTGAFVTLRDAVTGDLRGCIGRMSLQSRPVNEIVAELAVSAATQDPRFDPVERDEIDRLSVEVSLLEEPVPVDGVHALDPKSAGVVVRCGWKQGVLLPDIDGIDTPEEQLGAVLRKARIRPDEGYELLRFEARKHR